MRLSCYPAALMAAFSLHFIEAGAVQAETLPRAAAVTLEFCGDIKAEEVQMVLAIEYQKEEFGDAMLSVRCHGEVATLRIIGPSHPRGRIAVVNLKDIDAIARSRTIAVLAAELWTAPEATAKPVPTLRVVPAPPPPPRRVRFGAKYRSGASVGLAIVQNSRSVYAKRASNRYGAQGDFRAVALQLDWSIGPWVGVFTEASVSEETSMSGLSELNAPVRWRRTDTGLYIPLWRKRLRIDLRFSAGTDTITTQGIYQRNSERTILPRYSHVSAGLDMAYALNKRSTLTARASTHRAHTTDDDYPKILGVRVGAAYYYQFDGNLRGHASAETISLSDTPFLSGGGRYTDKSTSLSVAISYTH